MYRDDVISFVDDDNDDEGSLWAVPYEYMLHTEIHTEIGVYDAQSRRIAPYHKLLPLDNSFFLWCACCV